jgi:hypothetical protein
MRRADATCNMAACRHARSGRDRHTDPLQRSAPRRRNAASQRASQDPAAGRVGSPPRSAKAHRHEAGRDGRSCRGASTAAASMLRRCGRRSRCLDMNSRTGCDCNSKRCTGCNRQAHHPREGCSIGPGTPQARMRASRRRRACARCGAATSRCNVGALLQRATIVPSCNATRYNCAGRRGAKRQPTVRARARCSKTPWPSGTALSSRSNPRRACMHARKHTHARAHVSTRTHARSFKFLRARATHLRSLCGCTRLHAYRSGGWRRCCLPRKLRQAEPCARHICAGTDSPHLRRD